MSTADVLSHLAIPGLHQQPTLDDMGKSGDISLIKEFGVQNKFSLHLAHGHVKMARGMVMAGMPMDNLPGLWTHPTKANQLDLGALHGYVFGLGAGSRFHPYECRQGPPPPMTANDNDFIAAARKYLELNGLAGLIGVELLDQDTLGKHPKEFVLSDTDGTVMLPADEVNPTKTYRITGWNAVEGITDLKHGSD